MTVYGDLKADPNDFGVIVNGVPKPLSSPTDWMFIKAMLPAAHGNRKIESYVGDLVREMKDEKERYGSGWGKVRANRASDALAGADSRFALGRRTINGQHFLVWVYGTDGITDEDSA